MIDLVFISLALLIVYNILKLINLSQYLNLMQGFRLFWLALGIYLPEHLVNRQRTVFHFTFSFTSYIGSEDNNIIVSLEFFSEVADDGCFIGALQTGVK